jgi:anhydro-N-acetylmuramic acid kinase
MVKNEYKVIGVMSGTSLDGIDLAYITFSFNHSWDFKIEKAETVEYDIEWLKILQNLVLYSLTELKDIDDRYTRLLAKVVKAFINRNNIKTIDAICSHGHTALHQPEKGFTYQIGNKEILSKELKQTVVCDFRIQDVRLGGQGAPLVPIGDQLLFGSYDYCLNLGGFANISTEKESTRIAYDICPVNTVLNHYASKLGFSYDDKGKMASQGKLASQLLHDLDTLKFYSLPYPKSLGLEFVKKEILPLIESYNLDPKDVLRTFVEHVANQISLELKKQNSTVLITGGGAYNLFLIDRIKSKTESEILIPSKQLVNYKEALIFGLLGVLKLRGEVNCLSSVTGAKYDHSSGHVFYSG